jgi:hypothetical protein
VVRARELSDTPAATVAQHLAAIRMANGALASAADAGLAATLAAVEANLDRVERRVQTLDAAELEAVARIVQANQALFEAPMTLPRDGTALAQLHRALAPCSEIVLGGSLLEMAVPDSGALAVSAAVAHCGTLLFGATATVMRTTQILHVEPSVVEFSPDSASRPTFVAGVSQTLEFEASIEPLSVAVLTSLDDSDEKMTAAARAVDAVGRWWPTLDNLLDPNLPQPPPLGAAGSSVQKVYAGSLSVDPSSVTNGPRLVASSANGTKLMLTFALRGTWQGAKKFEFTLTHDNGVQEPLDRTFGALLYHGEGCGADERFRILDEGAGPDHGRTDCTLQPDLPCDGSGLVRDTLTGRTWARWSYFPGAPPGLTQTQAASHCASKGARLPQYNEAKGLFDGLAYCAFPNGFSTWTSTTAYTPPGSTQNVWVVAHFGEGQVPVTDNSSVLCVK